jgi:hypothetical protein
MTLSACANPIVSTHGGLVSMHHTHGSTHGGLVSVHQPHCKYSRWPCQRAPAHCQYSRRACQYAPAHCKYSRRACQRAPTPLSVLTEGLSALVDLMTVRGVSSSAGATTSAKYFLMNFPTAIEIHQTANGFFSTLFEVSSGAGSPGDGHSCLPFSFQSITRQLSQRRFVQTRFSRRFRSFRRLSFFSPSPRISLSPARR